MFQSVLNSAGDNLTILSTVECTMASLFFWGIIATCYYFTGRGTKNFCAALVLLPAMVQIVIMLVNGSIGTGMAIVGAFSLIRFRSLPGNSHDISCIFFLWWLDWQQGWVIYITYAVFVTIIIGAAMIILHLVPLPQWKPDDCLPPDCNTIGTIIRLAPLLCMVLILLILLYQRRGAV